MAAYLHIKNYISISYQLAVESLKNAKREYLKIKKDYQQLRDEYANSTERTIVKELCHKEKFKII